MLGVSREINGLLTGITPCSWENVPHKVVIELAVAWRSGHFFRLPPPVSAACNAFYWVIVPLPPFEMIRFGGVWALCAKPRQKLVLLSASSGFDVDFDFYFFADEHAARFEYRVPPQSKVLAIDGRFGTESSDRFPPRVFPRTLILDLECNGVRRAPNRQVAVNDVFIVAFGFDA